VTVLVVLIGLLISHYATGVRQVRRFDLFLAPAHWVHRRYPDPAWLMMIGLILTCLVVAAAAEWLLMGVAGLFGWFVLALATFIYCLGPRDLDLDVQHLLEHGLDSSDPAVAETRRAMRLRADDEAPAAAAAIYHAALSRWFGLLFWFMVLGVPGALLYRLVRAGLQEPFGEASIDWLARLRAILDWPVLLLVVLAAGLCSDLDRILRVWRQTPDDAPLGGMTPELLDRVAAAELPAGASPSEAVDAAHRQVWRMLILWLVVMSLILIAGWLV